MSLIIATGKPDNKVKFKMTILDNLLTHWFLVNLSGHINYDYDLT